MAKKLNKAQRARAGLGATLAATARAKGLTRQQLLAQRQHRSDVAATATASHPWNKPGLSYGAKMLLRDAQKRHQAAVAWRHPKDAKYQAAVEYSNDVLPPAVRDALNGAVGNSFIGPDQGQSGAPTFSNNLLAVGIAGVVLYFIWRKRKRA